MPGISWHIPTKPLAPEPACCLAKPRYRRTPVRLVFVLAVATSYGCQSPQAVDEPVPLPAILTQAELIRTAKQDFQLCVNAFYRDDWKQAGFVADRLKTLSQRWQEQPAPAGKQAEFQENTAGMAQGVEELKAAIDKRDVEQTTQSLRKIAAHLAVLEKMP